VSFSPRSFRLLRSFRSSLAAGLAAATMASLLLGVSPAASAGAPSVVLSQDVATRSPGEVHTVTATVTDASGQPAADGTPVTFTISGPAKAITVGSPLVGLGLYSGGAGGWALHADGTVGGFGAPNPVTVTAPTPVDSPAVDLVATPTGAGYWEVTADGHVLTAGDATWYGDLRSVTLNRPIVDISPIASGQGYYLVASDGGIFAFGAAPFLGSPANQSLPAPIVAVEPAPTGNGYWMVGSDGTVYAFGNATWAGDMHGTRLNRPVVDLASTADGTGYWMVTDDGGIFAFNTPFYGSLGARSLNGPVSRIIRTAGGHGYLMSTRDGGIWSFGDGPSLTNPGGYTVPTAGGQATLPFSSDTTGDSTVGASIGGSPATATATPVTVHWASGPPATITLTGDNGNTLLTSQTASVTATVKDANGYPVDDGTPVLFTVSGTGAENPGSATVPTSGGTARFTFGSSATGRSYIVATTGGQEAAAQIDWRTPAPDLRLTLGATPTTVPASGQVGFTATVSSSGSTAATGARLTVPLPAGTSVGRVDPGAWSCDTSGGSLLCDTGPLANPGSSTLQFQLLMGSTPGNVPVSATVTPANGPDFSPADNTTQTIIRVVALPSSVTLTQPAATAMLGDPHPVTATADAADGTLVTFGVDTPSGPLAGGPFTAFDATPDGTGYWLASSSGTVYAEGSAVSYGNAGALAAPVVDLRSTPSGKGYWIAAADGTVVSKGDAASLGSVPAAVLDAPVLGMGVTPTGNGYWLATAKGRVYSFGDAQFFGDPSGINANVVSFAATTTGHGYWMVASDGGIFAFGDAAFRGSLGGMHLNSPVVDLAPIPSGDGYWLVSADGGVFSFGSSASFYGSTGGQPLGGAIVGLRPRANGYWLFGRDGAVFAYGQAEFMGPVTTAPLSSGHATVNFTSAHAGTTDVVAAVGAPGAMVSSAPLPTTWMPAGTGQLTLSPAQSTVNVGVTQHVTATVTDPSGAAVADGTAVSFTVSGPGSAAPTTTSVTTTGGVAEFALTSPEAGTSTVTASSGSLSASATVDWVVPPNPPSAPRTVTATAGDASAVVKWKAPTSDGGSAVFQYTVTASPGGKTVTAGPGVLTATVDGLQNGTAYTFTVTATNSAGTSPSSSPSAAVTPRGSTGGSTGGTGGSGSTGGTGGSGTSGTGGNPAPGSSTNAGSGGDAPGAPVPARAGYWMLGAGGVVYAFGDAPYLGQPALAAGVDAVDLEPTPSGGGYWIVDSNGVVHVYGDAVHLGDADGRILAAGEKVTSLSATPSGAGYWIFTTRGRVLPFGDARFFGDMSKVALNGPVLDSMPTPTGLGYYMVASDGGIFAFGDAHFVGSMGGKHLNKPVQSLVPDSDGSGYWLVASDGGIFAFDAPFRGSMGGQALNQPVKGMVRYGDGYLMVATDGGIFSFSDKPFVGSLGANPPSRPIVSVAALP